MSNFNQKQYEENLKLKQSNHLQEIENNQFQNFRPCLHDSCTECVGTGKKKDGSVCIHFISCNCYKCSASY